MKNEQGELLRASQVAKRLGVSKSLAYTLMRRREIPVVVIGGKSVRVRSDDLEAFILKNLDMGYGQTAW